jgi:PAS domain S-box-containing protein
LIEHAGKDGQPMEHDRELLQVQVAQQAADLSQLRAQLDRESGERARVDAELQQRNRELALLGRASQAFSSTLDTTQVLSAILSEVRRLLNVVACSVWLLDAERTELVCREAIGRGADVVRGWRLPASQGIAGWVARTGSSLNVSDAQYDERHFAEIDRLAGLELHSILGVPLQVQGRVIGVLEVLDLRAERFSEAEVLLVELSAASAANAIENAGLYRDLDKARRQWEEIFQAVGHPALILDPAHHILAANRAALRAAGLTEDELPGKRCYDVLHDNHDSGKPPRGCPLEELLRSGSTESVEMEIEAFGGTYLVSCTPVLDDQGQLQQVIHIATEITELKRAEQRLEESRAQLERRNQALTILNEVTTTVSRSLSERHALEEVLLKLLELTGLEAGWVWMLDDERRTMHLAVHRGLPQPVTEHLAAVEADEAWLDGLLQEDQPVIAEDISELPWYGPWLPEAQDGSIVVTVPIQARQQILGVLSLSSGRAPEMRVYERGLLTAIGHQIGVTIENLRLLQDASEMEVLRELDRLRSELIANVSHELRTPLGLIRMLSTALLMEEVTFDAETHRQFLGGIEEETDRLEGIVDNLLDLSRMESGRLQLDRHSTDLVKLVRDAAAAMEIELAGYRLAYDLPGTPLIAMVDAKRLEQVLRNLLNNAVKYSPVGAEIVVRASQHGDEIAICVQDEGIGIPPGEQDRIFERFYRADNELTRRTPGAGLGLSICKWIVEAHGGRIEVQSAPGEGSRFYVVLPAPE